MAGQRTPARTFKLGLIEAAIWMNDDRPNVTFHRSYKKGDQWETTTSFNAVDLPVIAELARVATIWILNNPPGRNGQDEQS